MNKLKLIKIYEGLDEYILERFLDEITIDKQNYKLNIYNRHTIEWYNNKDNYTMKLFIKYDWLCVKCGIIPILIKEYNNILEKCLTYASQYEED